MLTRISTLLRPSALWLGRPVGPYYSLEHQHFLVRQSFFLSSTSSTSKRGHHSESSADGECCPAVRVLSTSSDRSLMNLLWQNTLLEGGAVDMEAHLVLCQSVLDASFSLNVSVFPFFPSLSPALTMHAGMCSRLSKGHPVPGLGRSCHIPREAAVSSRRRCNG